VDIASTRRRRRRGRVRNWEGHGVAFVDPSREELAANRKIMQADVATLIKDAKLSPEVVRLTDEAIGGKA